MCCRVVVCFMPCFTSDFQQTELQDLRMCVCICVCVCVCMYLFIYLFMYLCTCSPFSEKGPVFGIITRSLLASCKLCGWHPSSAGDTDVAMVVNKLTNTVAFWRQWFDQAPDHCLVSESNFLKVSLGKKKRLLVGLEVVSGLLRVAGTCPRVAIGHIK
jgi:hypothetical protein